MKIAVDAMGGDYAPEEVAKGAVEAAEEVEEEVLLVGNRERIEACAGELPQTVKIVDAEDVIEMDERPTVAVKNKPNSSIVVACRMVREGKVGAVVSAGNTGAFFVAGITTIGRLKQVERPAIACLIPSVNGYSLLLDAGANVNCKPSHLYQFGVMGAVYAREVLKVPKPKVGLLNIGEEEGKGNWLTEKASLLLADSNLNFCGNIEPDEILYGKADVVVADGFVGNSILKFGEGVAEFIMGEIKRRARFSQKIGLFLLKGLFRELLQKIDYTEYGGAPLLGLKGVAIICHGRSRRKAIKNAIKVASSALSHHINEKIESSLQ
jgi:glycerol-3-phosphate acyltransferase PlsX